MRVPRDSKDSALLLPVTSLKGVGGKIAERLGNLGIESVLDLLFHLPLRYQDRTQLTPIGGLIPNQDALIEGNVELAQVKFGRRRSLLCRVSDGTGALTLRFFHFSKAQQQNLQKGMQIRCYGTVRKGPTTFEMVHPEYSRIGDTNLALDDCLTPIYPTTAGLHQRSLRKLTDQALERLHNQGGPGNDSQPELLEELLPPALLPAAVSFANIAHAIEFVHRPPPEAPTGELMSGLHPAQRRLAFDELLAHHLSLRQMRTSLHSNESPVLTSHGELANALLEQLPFALTAAQRRVYQEIQDDIGRPEPMLRLLQGDVGSGKTVIAALAALEAIENGYQAALMVPTELLAEQHLKTFRHWLGPLDIPVIWLSGRLTKAQRSAALEEISNTPKAMVIGTHALFQADVHFSNLALVIVDEQHRFGVHQRLLLRDKGRTNGQSYPHQLIMTATPIPRTLAMTAYAELDTSIIDELPPNRQPIKTSVVPDGRRDEVFAGVAEACAQGRQVYLVCTLIDESDALQAQAATDTADQLMQTLTGVRVGLVHGRMKDTDKEAVMTQFAAGDLDLLVATTVIEVGVDVPNASLMIIENAERLGLAQLHQLRGRVGRGSQASACILLYRQPLSRLAKERLGIMRETTDGFVIAERDLELRGPGELLGTRQAGLANLRIADLARDRDLVELIPSTAESLLETHPDKVTALIDRWIGKATDYAEV